MTTNLTVHRNRIESRRKRDLAKDVRCRVEKLVRDEDIRAYAFVGISASGNAFALWNTGAILPQWAFADTIGTILRDDIAGSGVKDDWRPNLTLKGTI